MDSFKLLLSIIITLIDFGLAFLYFCLIRIFIDIEIIGYYTVITSFFLTFAFITRLGFGIAHIKYFSESKNVNEEAICNGALLYFRMIQFLFYIILMLVLIIITPIYKEDIRVVFFLFLGSILRMGSILFIHLFYGKQQIVKRYIPGIIGNILEIILLLVLINFLANDLWLLGCILFISNSISFALHLISINSFKFRKPTKEVRKKYLILSLPFMFSTSLSTILLHIDILLLYAWVPIEDIVNYDTAKTFYSFFLVIFSIFNFILLSTFSKNIKNNNIAKNLEIIKKLHKFLNFFFIPLLFLIALFSTNFFVLIFGPKYKAVGLILTILFLDLIISSTNLGVYTQLKALEQIKLLIIIAIINFLMCIIFIIIFVAPFFLNMGIIGAALSIVITRFLIELITRPYFYKKYKIGFHFWLFVNLFIMLGIFVIQSYINSILNVPLHIIPLFVLIDLFVYFALGYLVGSINKEDIRFLLRTINIINIKAIIVEEFKID